MLDNAFMRTASAIMFACAFFATSAKAVRALVIIYEPQPAQRVEGVVLDASDAAIAEMMVTDRSEDGVTVLLSTKTDRNGLFRFSAQRGKTVYCLRFDHPLFNPLQVKLKLDKNAPARGITARPHIGG